MADDAAWNTCEGTFYDSGGPGGNYASSQNMTATLCPGGGAGSGASSAIHFNSFSVGSALDPGDVLTIYDGTTTTDPLLATGDPSNGLAGQTFTATGSTGCLTFHWVSSFLGTGPGWVAEVVTGPDAGDNSSLTICSGQPSFPLADALNGDPDVGGSWIGPDGPHVPVFDPGTDPGGVYTYTVIDGSLCTDSATVTITSIPGPDAGDDGVLSICDISPPVDLINSLSGTPQSGGTWTGPGGASDGIYDPATDDPGDYTYTVDGVLPCPDATATVTVILTGPPDAGIDGELVVCDTLTALDLFTGLEGTPDASGVWQDLDDTGALTGGTLNTTGLAAGEYVFLYAVVVIGCGTDEALLSVQVLEGVEVSDLERMCDGTSGTSVISFTISHGDAATYSVAGVPGTISTVAPFIFTSDTLSDSLAYAMVVSDLNACGSVSIDVEACVYPPHVFIPELFSPNGDGINESFQIPGLEDFPRNELHIFNRWGSEVYHASEYHRRKAWDGASMSGSSASDLPAGTYYYVLDLGNGTSPSRGFVYLSR